MASFALAGPFYREPNEDSPKSLFARVTRTIFLKLRAVPGRFQNQSKGIKTHTRYRIRYALSLIRYSWPAKKTATQGRSIRSSGRLVGTRTPDLYRVNMPP